MTKIGRQADRESNCPHIYGNKLFVIKKTLILNLPVPNLWTQEQWRDKSFTWHYQRPFHKNIQLEQRSRKVKNNERLPSRTFNHPPSWKKTLNIVKKNLMCHVWHIGKTLKNKFEHALTIICWSTYVPSWEMCTFNACGELRATYVKGEERRGFFLVEISSEV